MHPAPSVIIFTIFSGLGFGLFFLLGLGFFPVSYTHLRAHETDSYLVCRLLLEKKKKIESQHVLELVQPMQDILEIFWIQIVMSASLVKSAVV